MHPHQLTDVAAIREFVFAGNARITLVSRKTGDRYTYRVSAPREKPGLTSKISHFVSVLTGPSNDADYSYLGQYFKDTGGYRHGFKSKIGQEAPSARAWYWFDATVLQNGGTIPESLEVWHDGRCAVCSRVLTVPESIERGIGPECAGKLGIE